MHRRSRSKASPHKLAPDERPFTTADVRLIPGVSSPVYAYGTCGLQPIERVADDVMKLNEHLAQVVRETGVTFTLYDLDQRFQALLLHLEDDGICRRDVDCSPIITKEQWLLAQLLTIQRVARGEKL